MKFPICAHATRLTHEILRETVPGAPVNEHAPVAVYVRHVHGRALHFWISEPHLQMEIVHVLEELAKVPAGGPYWRVVAQIAEEPHETPAKVSHEHVGGRFDCVVRVCEQVRRRGRQFQHQTVRVYVMRVEHVPLATGRTDHLAPSVLAVLQLRTECVSNNCVTRFFVSFFFFQTVCIWNVTLYGRETWTTGKEEIG